MAKRRRTLGVSGLPFLLGACALFGPYEYSEPWRNALRAKGSPVVVALERDVCLKDCPVYRVLVREDGTVLYEGKANVKERGTHEWRIPPRRVAQLLDDLVRLGVFSLKKSRYPQNDCTDQPTATLYARKGPNEVEVYHDYGDRSAPEDLLLADGFVDAATNASAMTGVHLVLSACAHVRKEGEAPEKAAE